MLACVEAYHRIIGSTAADKEGKNAASSENPHTEKVKLLRENIISHFPDLLSWEEVLPVIFLLLHFFHERYPDTLLVDDGGESSYSLAEGRQEVARDGVVGTERVPFLLGGRGVELRVMYRSSPSTPF